VKWKHIRQEWMTEARITRPAIQAWHGAALELTLSLWYIQKKTTMQRIPGIREQRRWKNHDSAIDEVSVDDVRPAAPPALNPVLPRPMEPLA